MAFPLDRAFPQDRHEEKLLEDARNSLFAHFSSKSTNETAILVGLAVAFFADIQAYDALKLPLLSEQITFLTVSLAIIIFFVTHAIGRLVYWGLMATIISFVKAAANDNKMREWLVEMKPKSFPESEIASTYLARIIKPSQEYLKEEIKERKTVAVFVHRMTDNKWFKIAYFILVALVYILALVFSKALLCT